MEQLEITIGNDGNTTIKVVGIAGPSCKKTTAGIEKALGTTTSDTNTTEYSQIEQVKENATVRANNW